MAKKTITMGMHKGMEVTITRKKASSKDNVIVKIGDREIEVPKSFIK